MEAATLLRQISTRALIYAREDAHKAAVRDGKRRAALLAALTKESERRVRAGLREKK